MKFPSIDNLNYEAKVLRKKLDATFAPETALGGIKGSTASSGHCAAVAFIVFNNLGGFLVSANVDGNSHWFNRVTVDAKPVDLDITGDQFGRPDIQIGPEGSLYDGTRIRQPSEVKEETRSRAATLAKRLQKISS